MHSKRAGWLALAAAVLAVMAAPATARGDAVAQWNINSNNAILAANPTAHASTLSFAMVQGAVYDAVNGIVGGYTPYLVKPAVSPLVLHGRSGGDRGIPRPRRRRSVLADGRARDARRPVRRFARRDPERACEDGRDQRR